MNNLSLQLVTPEKTVLSQQLASLTCNTEMGEITILPNHIPLVANLRAGELHAKTVDGKDMFLFVAGGFVEVKQGSQVVILADEAEHHYAIDVEKAERAAERARGDMKKYLPATPELARVSASFENSMARVRVAKKHAHRQGPLSGRQSIDN